VTKLSPIKSSRLIQILEQLGFQKTRQKGSHVFMRHPDGRCTVVPVHKGEDISKGLLHKILDDIELSIDQLNEPSGCFSARRAHPEARRAEGSYKILRRPDTKSSLIKRFGTGYTSLLRMRGRIT
jgi:predicted RNA binding protein YcfA (HicA-like mRNA interferase family)